MTAEYIRDWQQPRHAVGREGTGIPAPESEPILAAAESSFRKWLAEQGLIGQDVALSAIAAALHVHGVQRVEIIEPTQNMAISDIQAARCESFTISEGGRNE